MGLVPNAIVVPVSKNSQWVLYYGNSLDQWQLDSNVARQDFQNQGWTIIAKVAVGDRSYSQEAMSDKFYDTYRSNPSILLFGEKQTPVYGTDAAFWAWFTHREPITGEYPATSPGTVYAENNGDNAQINGNARRFNAKNYVLIRFLTDGGRTVIVVWTSIRFDTGQLTGYILAWRWVAVYGAYHEKNWYILDDNGNIVDSEIIPSDDAEPSGDNPEDNPLLDDDYTDPDEPLPDEPIYDPMRQTRAILLIAGLVTVLVAMGGFTLWFGKKIGLFI